MPIKIESPLNYQILCQELGITLPELLNFVNNKEKFVNNYPPVKITDIIDEFLINLYKLNALNRRSDTTIDTYKNFLTRFKNFINEKDGSLTLDKLNEDLFLEFMGKSVPRKSKKISDNTYNKYQAILRKVLYFAFEKDYIEKDLRKRFQLKNNYSLPRYLSNHNIELALQAALQRTYGYRNRAMFLFLLGTGCRVSELVNIRICDLNFDECFIFVREGKGNKERYIPMFDEVKYIIRHYFKISNFTSNNMDCDGYLFTRDEGNIRTRKISVRSVQYLVRNVFDDIGLNENYTVHSFRHTFAVKCLQAGIKLHYITQMLGHEDPKTTSIYTKLMPSDLKKEVQKYYPFAFEDLLEQIF